MVVRGAPDRLAKDAWWLDDEVPPRGLRAGPLLLGAVLLADWLFWGVSGGIGFALWIVVAAGAIFATVWCKLSWTKLRIPTALLCLAVLPLIEVVQFATVIMALLGLMVFGVLITTENWKDAPLVRAVFRLPIFGIAQCVTDVLALQIAVPDRGRLRGVMFDWALPVGVGAIFVVLFAAANPLLDQWLVTVFDFDAVFLPNIERVVFWVFMATAIWPLLRLTAMSQRLLAIKQGPVRPRRAGLINARSVQRALIVFNVIFAIQTMLDLGYLWGGVALPDGMTYAKYAHRGAYPLLATALLAGMFAILAQPYLGEGQGLRRMLYLWIGQNLLLVISSILRLDLYVDVYGLTRLRVAAFVWMTVVAIGLVLMIVQLVQQRHVTWFFKHAFAVGLMGFYGCTLLNTDGLIARNNLANGQGDDYLCGLGEGATAAMRAYENETGDIICASHRPYLTQPNDWREWGYRNARMRHSLAALEEQQ